MKAHPEALDILKKLAPYPAGGLVHSFTGSQEVAKDYLELGFLISVGAAATLQGFQTFKKTVTSLPPDRLAIETDAPDQLPEILDLLRVAEAVAALRGTTGREVLAVSAENIRRLFGRL